MNRSNKKIMGIGVFALILMVWGLLAWKSLHELEPVISLSISSDGHYVISAHEDGALVLWDIDHQEREVLSDNANIYSAYFIEKSDAFLWQDQDDVVYVQRVGGEVIEEFEHFPTYGHVMDSTFSDYLASDERWNIFHGHGDAMRPVMQDGIIPSFVGSGKILKITLSEQGRKFVSAGSGDRESPSVDEVQAVAPERRFSNYTGVTLWDLDTFQPIAMLPGNSFKVDATISPDGEWVVSGDENTLGFFWNTELPEERHDMASYNYGLFIEGLPEGLPEEDYRDDSKLIDVPRKSEPDEYGIYRPLATPTTISLAFINGSDEFLRIGYSQYRKDGSSQTYAALFEAGNPWPQEYLDLGTDPFPSINNYSRNLSIDSAPNANLLVTGHAFDGGITVYRYDPEERTLTREWVGR
ncbi:WD40 repeat domain-containing protein [Halomonas dongshanensis]|uniref:WD40 repeat domain-containing protein n=1 Tax=Halomonas dongshanensis TaxID=2890835 RepID=A0ABT2EFR3_9GAMM|nr:WD40 repeat domain-containing protein [Halomonas dongshanensis]MCS2609457.1 WD40 repeat domain-containing protein [Halomonas dongshanensis]